MNNYSQILLQAYETFMLHLGGKKVPTPYRINIPFQPDRKKYGKSDPKTLVSDAKQFARKQDFDLDKAAVEEIRQFMEKNQLGIDCSGFAYHLLDTILKKIGKGSLLDNGFPKASSTNVALLASDQFSNNVENLSKTKPGDLIRLNSQSADHVLIILKVEKGNILYAHSSGLTSTTGVHTGEIINGQFPAELSVFSYNEKIGDGIRRLKIL